MFNPLVDIMLRGDYAALLGYMHEEFERYFAENIAAFAERQNCAPAEIVRRFHAWYDNYRFSPQSEAKVLNPVSVGYALTERRFKNYWVGTGTTSMVIERLQQVGKIPPDLDGIVAKEEQLSAYDTHSGSIVALFYQAGYLTIKDVRTSGMGSPHRPPSTRSSRRATRSRTSVRARRSTASSSISLRTGSRVASTTQWYASWREGLLLQH